MEKILKSGNPIYVCETTHIIPSIRELINFPMECSTFIDSATQNPKDTNASLYAQFDNSTYRAFIFAFAIQLGQTRSTYSHVRQIEMNARRVERLCKRREIKLSESELSVIETCKRFSSIKLYFKEQVKVAEQFKIALAESYLGLRLYVI